MCIHQTRLNFEVLRRDMMTPWPAVVPDFIGLALTPKTLNVTHVLCMGFLGDVPFMYTRGGVRNMIGLGASVLVWCMDIAPEWTK